MTISIWRYSHLALAVSSFLFIALASVTGIILSFEAVNENTYAYEVKDLNSLRLNEVLPVLMDSFPEISELNVNEKGWVRLEGFDAKGEKVNAFIDPKDGKILGTPHEQSGFFKWVTALHRSLFLHELGRFFIGLTAFLLLLITISGAILVAKRQHGWKRFFKKITRDSFAQYYHVVLGRLTLIPIFIIAASGTWLSWVRFGFIPETKVTHRIEAPEIDDIEKRTPVADFARFRQIKLSDVKSIGFPFVNDDPEEYFTIKLHSGELVLNQFDGSTLSEIKYPNSSYLTTLSLNLHTGRASIVWAIIIGIASINILFFIYSGFTITLRRRRNRIKNKFKASEARFVILTGSENGSTLFFAGAVHKQLLAQKQVSFLGELNGYTQFPKAEHILIFTSTYGLGDAPGNAGNFLKLLQTVQQSQSVKVSVVGFGSHAYPDFCAYAREVDDVLKTKEWVVPYLEFHTVDDKSPEQFAQWVKKWNARTGILLTTTAASYNQAPAGLQKLKVIRKTNTVGPEQSFLVTLRPLSRVKYTSGDLLAIYPAADNRERFYSIGKVNNDIQLVVKLHEAGLGSEYLHALKKGDIIKGSISHNQAFHFPKKSPSVILISNGTGIAPFLGMLEQNRKRIETHLYAGFRQESEMTNRYRQFAEEQIRIKQLESMHFAFSREGNHSYVMDLIRRDAEFFAAHLENGATIMICGSLEMQQDVEIVLNTIAMARNDKELQHYKSKGQILSDCY